MDFTAYQANSRIIRVSVTDESGSPKNLTGQTITMVFMRPAVATQSPFDRASVPCNNCGGTGLVAISEAEIVRVAVEHARLHYWPAFEARCASSNGKGRD